MSKKVVFLTLLTACLVATAVQSATVYKCKDESGQTFFSDHKCAAEDEQTEIELKDSQPQDTAAQARRKKQKKLLESFETDRQEKAEERRKAKAQRRERKRAQCIELQERLAKLQSRICVAGVCEIYALTGTDEDGNEVILSERAKQAEVKRLKQSIAEDCV